MTLQNDLLNDPALCSNIIPRNICDIPQNYPHKRGYNTLLYLSLKLNQKTNKKLNQNQKNQKTNKKLNQTTSYGRRRRLFPNSFSRIGLAHTIVLFFGTFVC